MTKILLRFVPFLGALGAVAAGFRGCDGAAAEVGAPAAEVGAPAVAKLSTATAMDSANGERADDVHGDSEESMDSAVISEANVPKIAVCTGKLDGHADGSVTWYSFDQGISAVNCSFAIQARNPDRVAHVATGGGRYFAAMNTADYANAAMCGVCVEVQRDDGRRVTVTIVDQCPVGTNPGCKVGHLDLSKAAFQEIGSLEEGYLGTTNGGRAGRISWRYVACPVTESMSFRLKDPKNPHWNEILVQGHRYAIASVEVQVDGEWVKASRQHYNYWRPPGGNMGPAPYVVRATDINGASVVAGLALTKGDQTRDVQFLECL